MKILHLIDSGGLYGAERMLINLVEEQISAGIQPVILSVGLPGERDKPLEVEAKRRNLPLLAMRMKAGLNIVKGMDIMRYARDNNFDVIHSHGYKFNILVGAIPKLIRRIPVVSTVHGYVTAKKFSRMWVYQYIDRWQLRRIDKVVFVSRHMLEQPFFAGREFKNPVIIENGINIQEESNRIKEQMKYSPSRETRSFLSQRGRLLGYIGRLSREKGVMDLPHILKRVCAEAPDTRLIIVGEGACKSRLLESFYEHGLMSNVHFAGYDEYPYYYLKKIDLLLMPSYTEGLPMLLLEALLAECLVLATAVGGVPDIIADGKTGFLVDDNDRAEFASIILRVFSQMNGNERLSDLRLAAKKKIECDYSSKKMADAYNAVYQSVVPVCAL